MQSLSSYNRLSRLTSRVCHSVIRKCSSTTSAPTPPVSSSSSASPSTQTEEVQQRDTTHFGFKTIPKDSKEGLVGEVFHKVAGKYDLMNDVMSLGIHRVWKDDFIRTLNPSPGSKILDVAGGTGDIAFRCIENIIHSPVFFPRPSTTPLTPQNAKVFSEPSCVTVCDINPAMLGVGRERAVQRGYDKFEDPKLEWVEGNAEKLPFADNSMDAYTIAFGIRNCTNVPAVLSEAYRVLRVGGRFMCLEFGQVDVPMLQQLYDYYSFNFIPVWGKIISNDYESYHIRKFPDQQTFLNMIETAGFKMATYTNYTFGIAAVHSGWKLK